MPDLGRGTVGNRQSKSPCFPVDWQLFLADFFKFTRPMKKHPATGWDTSPAGLHFYWGISSSVSTALQALPRRSPKLCGHFSRCRPYPNVSTHRVFKSLQVHLPVCLRTHVVIPVHFSGSSCFYLLMLKIKEQKICDTFGGNPLIMLYPTLPLLARKNSLFTKLFQKD